MEPNLVDHWNNKYLRTETPNWIETQEPSILQYVRSHVKDYSAHILVGGVGDSNIVEYLLKTGYHNITVVDISQVALDRLAAKLKTDKVTYIQDNLVASQHIGRLKGSVDLYIDRAVLHFFTTAEEQVIYFTQLSDLISTGGFVMIGVFNTDNRAKCCGLDLQLYSEETLTTNLKDFDLLHCYTEVFEELNGNVRNYLYWIGKKA